MVVWSINKSQEKNSFVWKAGLEGQSKKFRFLLMVLTATAWQLFFIEYFTQICRAVVF